MLIHIRFVNNDKNRTKTKSHTIILVKAKINLKQNKKKISFPLKMCFFCPITDDYFFVTYTEDTPHNRNDFFVFFNYHTVFRLFIEKEIPFLKRKVK